MAQSKTGAKTKAATKTKVIEAPKGFKDEFAKFMVFVREHGVVGLAVGLAIGTQVGVTVKALVEGFVNPIVSFIVGSDSRLAEGKWVLIQDWYGRNLTIYWGQVLSSLIVLFAVSAVIYYVVHGFKLDKFDKKKE